MKFNSLDNRIIKKLNRNKIKYSIISILMIFSTALFVAFIQSYGYMVNELEILDKSKNVEEAYFTTDIPIDDIEIIEEKYDVNIESRKVCDINMEDDTSVRFISITNEIDKIILKEGQLPEDKREILLNSNYAKSKEINIGDKVTFNDEDYKVTGFGITPDYYNMLKSESDLLVNFDDFGVAYCLQETLDEFSAVQNEYLLVSSNDDNKELKEELNENNILIKWVNSSNNPRINLVSSSIKSSYEMGVTIATLLMFISSFVISIIISREIKSECSVIGTLMSLGYRKRELILHYLKGTILLAIFSGVIGYVLGCILAKPLIEIQNFSYEIPSFGINFDIYVLLMEVAILLVIVTVVNYMTLSRIISKSPLSLLRNELKVNKFITTKIDIKRGSYINRFRFKLALSNIFKMLILFISITMASILVFAGFGLKDSVNNFVEQYNTTIKYNYCYILNQYYKELPEENNSEASIIQNVIFNDDKNISVQGIKDESKFFDVNFDIAKDFDELQVVISSSIAKKCNLKIGDKIEIYNEVADEDIEWTIDDIVDWTSGDIIFIPIESFYEEFDVERDSYNVIYSIDELDINEDMVICENNKSEIIKSTETYQKTMKSMNYIILGISICMAIAIIYIVMIMIVEENCNNISLMKIMGYREKELKKLFLNINHILVPIAIVVGRLLAMFVIELSLKEQNYTLNGYVVSALNNSSTIISCVIIIATYLFTNIILNNKLRKVELTQVIKNRE